MPSSISVTVNSLDSSDQEFRKSYYRDTKSSWARRTFSSMYQYFPSSVLHPHAESVRRWNKFFIFSCVFKGFFDSLFLFLLSVKWDDKCIVVDRTMTKSSSLILHNQSHSKLSLTWYLEQMHVSEKDQVLMRCTTSISIPVNSLDSDVMDFPSSHNKDADDNWARKIFSPLYRCIPGIMHPHTKSVQIWSNFFIFVFLFAFLLQTLFIFMQRINLEENCIADYLNSWTGYGTLGTVVSVLLGLTNIFFLLHMILNFRVAYVDPESRVLVYDPKKVALNYLFGYFIIDFFLVLPIAQNILGFILETWVWSFDLVGFSGLVEVVSILQYLIVLCRILSMLADQSASIFVCKSWLSKCVINILAFFLFSHVVGSFWYYFATIRVAQCLINACGARFHQSCLTFISCSFDLSKYEPALWKEWKDNSNVTACFDPEGFEYGIYKLAVLLMRESNLSVRYLYSLSWGFQQISTLAGNQTPAFFVVEVLFIMFVGATGLLLFSLLIGNIQNFLQALGRRSLEMSVRSLDLEEWMSHRRLPQELKRQIRESERYNWLATRGVNELMLLENLPEDLQRDIRRHLFNFVENFPLFSLMEEPILDAIRERLKQKIYIKGSKVLVCGGLIDKMVFIVQGKLQSIGEDNNIVPLSEGDVCGEELITLSLEHYALIRDGKQAKILAHKLVSNRSVICLTNVEAFTLRVADLEEVTCLFSGHLIKSSHVQGNNRKDSSCRQRLPANRLKLAWRYRKKRLNH
ncbi:putative cyclic nucleotide-gated ion channel 20, chloroplastic [Apium graveolens]|uniref:putative cyclic nucleotide-gated ion channel 20, chloroplastic n=1 Tax=Apium graveolens TaxID=4045 RepID=UPI003D7BA5FF